MNIENTNCKFVNTVWIEKGIILTLIYYIIKKYEILLKKTIIIDNTKHRILMKILFSELKFSKFISDSNNNFYFNIRTINKKQDIIIDYINNYDDFINTKKIKLVPWYDMNDILIVYEYDSKKKLYIDNIKNFIINFNKCRRNNYNNEIYDKFIENKIINKYFLFNNLIDLVNQILTSLSLA